MTTTTASGDLQDRLSALKAELAHLAAVSPTAGSAAVQSAALATACSRVETLCRDVRAAPRSAAISLIGGLSDLVAALDDLERKLAAPAPLGEG